MKKSIFLSVILLVAMLASVNSAVAFTQREKAAQQELYNYLESQGINPDIDNTDNSVNFMYKEKTGRDGYENVIYWVTFKEKGASMLYTLHRRPIKLANPNRPMETTLRDEEAATWQANMLNAYPDAPYKAYVRNLRIDFEFPILASSTAEYIKIFKRQVDIMSNAKQRFDSFKSSAKNKVDSIHNFWMTNDTAKLVVPQFGNKNIEKTKYVTISNIDFRIVDAQGNEKVAYEDIKYSQHALFIQPQIRAKVAGTGVFNIGVRIYTPDGKLMVPDNMADMTMICPIDVKKKDKEAVYPLGVFGSSENNVWKPGKYVVKFYENDNLIKETELKLL